MPDFVRVNGRVLHYRYAAGAGPETIVFVNSLGTDLRIWDGVIDHLPPEAAHLSYDKSGHGLSEGGAMTIAALARDLAALLDALGIRKALVCGVSVGGMIAQSLASERPDLVTGLVLCNTSFKIGTAESWSDRIATLDDIGLPAMSDAILDRWFSHTFREGQPDKAQGYRSMLTRTPAEGYRQVCTAIRDADLTASTRRIACPTTCVAGADDLATPPGTVKALAELIKGTNYICLSNVGHLPCIEAPDRLAKILCNHLRPSS